MTTVQPNKIWIACVERIMLYAMTQKVDYKYPSNPLDYKPKRICDLINYIASKFQEVVDDNRTDLKNDGDVCGEDEIVFVFFFSKQISQCSMTRRCKQYEIVFNIMTSEFPFLNSMHADSLDDVHDIIKTHIIEYLAVSNFSHGIDECNKNDEV